MSTGVEREALRMSELRKAQAVMYAALKPLPPVSRWRKGPTKDQTCKRVGDPLGLRARTSCRVIARKTRRKRLSKSPEGLRRVSKRTLGQIHAHAREVKMWFEEAKA